jgi:hypothetical protein
MTRPPWEVADVIQRGGSRFLDRYRKSLTYPQVKVPKLPLSEVSEQHSG